jgi:hypothetical protein
METAGAREWRCLLYGLGEVMLCLHVYAWAVDCGVVTGGFWYVIHLDNEYTKIGSSDKSDFAKMRRGTVFITILFVWRCSIDAQVRCENHVLLRQFNRVY